MRSLDVSFKMHSIAKIFDIVKYFKKLKKSKIKKKKRERIEKMAKKGPKRKKAQFFFYATNPQNKTRKMSIAELNSV